MMDTLQRNGFEANLVGGCVRDMVLGRVPKDFDVSTNATPEQVRPLFEKSTPVGAKFGVVVVMVDGEQIEVATYRADGAYTDGRRPDEVRYSESAEEDVLRRDFTMNGLMAVPHDYSKHILTMDGVTYDHSNPVVLWNDGMGGDTFAITDFVGGFADVTAKLIRCIGDPDARFQEDPARMLRAASFVARLGFTVEKGTFDAIVRNVDRVKLVSMERVAEELFKLVTGEFAVQGLTLLASTGLFSRVFGTEFVSQHSMALTLERFAKFPTTDKLLGMSMLMTDTPGFSLALEAVKSLKLSSDKQDVVMGAVVHKLGTLTAHEDADVKLLLREKGMDNAVTLFEQDLGMGMHTRFGVEFPMNQVTRFRAMTPEDVNPVPMVMGKDLLAMGFKPSKLFSLVLGAVEVKQLNGEFATATEALTFARQMAEANDVAKEDVAKEVWPRQEADGTVTDEWGNNYFEADRARLRG